MTESTAVSVAIAEAKEESSGQKVAKAFSLRPKCTKFTATNLRANFRNRFESKGFSQSHREQLRGRVSQYDASTGRWLTKDPILFAGGDTNLYGYVLSDPINFIDPSGLSGTDNYRDGGGGADTGTNVFNTYCKITGKCDQIPMPPPPLIQQFGRRTFDLLNPPPPMPPLPPFLPPPLTPKTYQPPNPSCGGQ